MHLRHSSHRLKLTDIPGPAPVTYPHPTLIYSCLFFPVPVIFIFYRPMCLSVSLLSPPSISINSFRVCLIRTRFLLISYESLQSHSYHPTSPSPLSNFFRNCPFPYTYPVCHLILTTLYSLNLSCTSSYLCFFIFCFTHHFYFLSVLLMSVSQRIQEWM